VKLTVVGCSPACPNPGGAHSGYLVSSDRGHLLLDCGPGVLSRLRLDEPWPHVDAIAITHLHLDHWGDLVPWVWGSTFGPASSRPPRPGLWLPPRGRERLAWFGREFGVEDMFEKAFEVHEYETGTPFEAAGLEVLPVRVPHSEDSHGFRVGDGRVTLAYSGDSTASEQLVALAEKADLFLCEANLDRHHGPVSHLSAEEARDAFVASGAKRLLLTHRPVELPPPPDFELAHEGLELEL
jgi:ribonuclease BN (tRNA processing enzyme)